MEIAWIVKIPKSAHSFPAVPSCKVGHGRVKGESKSALTHLKRNVGVLTIDVSCRLGVIPYTKTNGSNAGGIVAELREFFRRNGSM